MTANGARAPGKLILSGEHAAVYGKPAIAMAVNCHADAHLTIGTESGVRFDIPGLDYYLQYSEQELFALHENGSHAYREFLEGRLTIQEVLPRAVELIPFAFTLPWIEAGRPPVDGIDVRLDIGIPVGCGMGSSAAVGLCMLRCTAIHLGVDLDDELLFDWSLTCERLMHGHPSGVDTHVSLHGGTFRYEAGNVLPRSVPPWKFTLINTGCPESSTGECVESVRARFGDDLIWTEFEAVTSEIDGRLTQDVDDSLLVLIRRNHELLCRIGVVPKRVQALIREIEARGGAAKVCGAGAVRGENAGVVLVLGEVSSGEICEGFNAHRIPCASQEEGTVCLD